MPADIAELIIQLRADISDLKTKMGTAEKQTTGFAKRAGGALDSLKQNWLGLTAATAGFVIVARRSFQAFAGFENKMRETNTLMGQSEKQFAEMTEAVRQMSTALPQTSTELATALYDIVSAGVDASNALAVLYRSAQAATAGVTDTQTAVRAGVAAVNAYGLEISELDRVYDIMFQTVKEGVLTFPDLSQNLGQVLPVARAAGVSLEEVGAAMATLTKGGMPVAVATTALRNAILKLAAPTADAKGRMQELGLSWEGLIPTMAKVAELNLDLEGMQAIVPDQRASRGIIALAQNFGELQNIMGEMEDAGGSMQAAFDEMLKSPAVQAKLLGNAFGLVRDRIIQAFGPAILSAIEQITHQVLILAGSIAGSESAVTDLGASLKIMFGIGRSVMAVINTAIDQVIIAFETVHRLVRAAAAVMTGNFAEAKLQMKTLGYEFIASGKAIDDRLKGIGAAFKGAAEGAVEKPAWIKTLQDMQKELEDLDKQQRADKGDTEVDRGPAQALAAEMRALAAEQKVAFAQLDQAYADGLLSAEAYYESKRTLVTGFANLEIKYLQQIYQLTEDENEQRQINAQILAKLNEAKAENIKLTTEEAAALAKQNEELEAEARKRSEILLGIDQRVAGGSDSMRERHEAELQALDQRHAAELAKLEELKASEAEIEWAHAQQRIEIEQMVSAQRQEALSHWLGAASAIVGQLQSIYAAQYNEEMRKENERINTIISNMRKEGASEEQLQKKKAELEKQGYKQAKELWEKQKRANIALALINAAQAIIKGFADYGPIVGAIMAGLTAVLTGIQIAQISRQEFPGAAKGGLITDGTSGTADDVPIMVSRGEHVAPAKSVQYYGAGVYEAMRQRRIPREMFAGMGGLRPFKPMQGRFQEGGLVEGGGDVGGAQEVTVVNFLDERLLEKYLDTPEGQKAVLNVIQERGYEVREIIG